MNYVVANIIVLIFEILYYSMFMYYSKQEGKFWKYVILFTIISIIGGFIGTNYLFSYIYLIVMIFIGINYFIKVKMYFRDIFSIIFMLLLSALIQLPIYFIGKTLNLIILFTFVYEILKVLLVYIFKNQLEKLYLIYTNKWNNNNFYIRYIFSMSLYIYIIITILLLIIF